MALLEVKNIFKTFDKKSLTTVNEISFKVYENEILSIIGPSGTGKSTTVKMICGLLGIDKGEVFFKGKLLADNKTSDQKLLSKISYVPQELNLDENKTIFENIAEALEGQAEDYIHVNVRDMIEVFGLQYKDEKLPRELSTGQKQRVQMAKALVTRPELIVLDEPFSNLDRSLQEELKQELLEILEERKTAAIVVTHDIDDALSTSSRVMLMAEGIIKQIDNPVSLYERPLSAYVAKFTGAINLLASSVKRVDSSTFYLKNSFGEFEVNSSRSDLEKAKFVYMSIRPHLVHVHPKGSFSGRVRKVKYFGHTKELWIQSVDKNKFIVKVPADRDVKIGNKIRFDIHGKDCFLLPI